MTKNVGIDLAIKHMTTMGIRFAEGRSKAAANLHVIEQKDEWKHEGFNLGVNVIKEHVILRQELYVPTGEDQYPCHSKDLEAIRVTQGTTESGKDFEIEDNWRRPGRAHRLMSEKWTGRTTFRLKASARKKYRIENEDHRKKSAAPGAG